MKIDCWVNLTAPVDNVTVRVRVFYKFTTYQPFTGVFVEDICAWLDGSKRSFALNWIMPLVVKYSNLNHPCPYSGYGYFKVDNLSINAFSFPQLVPAGRYRIDVSAWENDKYNIGNVSVFGAISDYRVVIV